MRAVQHHIADDMAVPVTVGSAMVCANFDLAGWVSLRNGRVVALKAEADYLRCVIRIRICTCSSVRKVAAAVMRAEYQDRAV